MLNIKSSTVSKSLAIVFLMVSCSGTPAPVKFDTGVKKDSQGTFSENLKLGDASNSLLISDSLPISDGLPISDSLPISDGLPTTDGGKIGDVACSFVEPLTIVSAGPLTSAQVGKAYQGSIDIKGGLTPYRFELFIEKKSAVLVWLSINLENGALTGLPNQTHGPLSFELRVTDSGQGSCRMVATKALEIRVNQCAQNEVLECFTATKDGVCGKGSTMCVDGVPGGCTNPTILSTDVAHCGSDCTACAPDKADRCVAGKCQCGVGILCGNGKTCCSGLCLDSQTDADNCGACGKKCLVGLNAKAVCQDGVCLSEISCLPGFDNCDPKRPKDCPTAIDTDFNHCGSCGNACPAQKSSSCEGGECVCGDDKTICSGTSEACCPAGQGVRASCADLAKGDETSTGIARCGTCNTFCSNPKGQGTATCKNKVCGAVCEEGWEDCGSGGKTRVSPPRDCSINIASDVRNCGGCGISCPSPVSNGRATCEDGVCRVKCNEGRTRCPGSADEILCVNTATDPANCGECDLPCSKTNASASSCIKSLCVPICLYGYGDCRTNLNDGCETPLNAILQCGSCTQGCSNSHIAPFCSVVPGVVPDSTPSFDPCSGGTCAVDYGDCNQNKITDGCETDLTTLDHCGSCGNACAAKQGQAVFCEKDATDHYGCVARCAQGFADCNANEGCETSKCTSEDCDDNPCNGCDPCPCATPDCDENPINGCEPCVSVPPVD